jgi:hexulose-6-phosphate isomerase
MSEQYLKKYADDGLFLMQGRLSPPEDGRFQSFPTLSWVEEIIQAPQVPLRGIEWIYDLYGEDVNPLASNEGRDKLKKCLAKSQVTVRSICADYFMDCPIVGADDGGRAKLLAKLNWLIETCPELGINRIVLPFVDQSRMVTEKDKADVIKFLEEALPAAHRFQVELHLETDFSPLDFASFLQSLDDRLIRVNYDAGNSAALGYQPTEEFAFYGDRIGSFHIKDRILGAGTVPLGEGDADFKSLRKALIEISYKGDFVMQVARGAAGDEIKWLQEQSKRACNWLSYGEFLGLNS